MIIYLDKMYFDKTSCLFHRNVNKLFEAFAVLFRISFFSRCLLCQEKQSELIFMASVELKVKFLNHLKNFPLMFLLLVLNPSIPDFFSIKVRQIVGNWETYMKKFNSYRSSWENS